MRTKLQLVWMLIFCIPLFSQDLKEAQLPKPNQISLTYLNSLGERNILYGQTPPNYNGELIIFNHGYIGSTESMLIGNEMYERAYEEGYQTAFVATTRGEGLWINGAILGQAIDQITTHYQVPEAYLVVHSNGGKASEVALFHENKRNKIKRVISLGTPFHGTQLADLSQNWWFKWLWSLTGLNDGAALSTTYYCENVVRPYFDNHSLNQPEKYYNLGVWGWNKGHTILKPAFITAGGYIFLDGGGENDGVTPYYSSKRPGGNVILPYDGSSKGDYDHIDILYGQYSWNYIQPYLKGNSTLSNRENKKQPVEENHYYEVVSDYQLVYSQNEYDHIMLSGKKNAEITIFHENPTAHFSANTKNSSRRINHYTTQMLIEEKDKTTFTLESDSKYVAVVREPEEVPVHYLFNTQEKYPVLSVKVMSELEKETKVSAVITYTHDLYGNAVQNPKSEVVFFEWNEKQQKFQLSTRKYSDGIYALYLTAEKEGSFKRNIASGFTIGKMVEKEHTITPVDIKEEKIATLANDVYSNTQIKVKNSLERTQVSVAVYNLNGHSLLTKEALVENGFIPLEKEIQRLPKGIYLIALKTKEGNQTLKFIKK